MALDQTEQAKSREQTSKSVGNVRNRSFLLEALQAELGFLKAKAVYTLGLNPVNLEELPPKEKLKPQKVETPKFDPELFKSSLNVQYNSTPRLLAITYTPIDS